MKERTDLRGWLELHREEMLADLAALTEIPSVAEELREMQSPSPLPDETRGKKAPVCEERKAAPFGRECRRALERMREIGERGGMAADDVDGYCLALEAGSGRTEIGIWNHLDVVPAGEGWTYPPFLCTEKNGYLIGRGVQDNKGPAIAAHYAMRYCRERGLLKHIRVRQILGCQEERGMHDAEYYLKVRPAPDFSFVADCGFPVCCGEKGLLRVTLESVDTVPEFAELHAGTVCNSVPAAAEAVIRGSDGNTRVISAEGIGGHAAFPEGTLNAVSRLCDALRKENLSESTLRAVQFPAKLSADGCGRAAGLARSDSISGEMTCNLGILSLKGGRIRAELDIRYPVTADSGQILSDLGTATEQDGMRVIGKHDSPPCYTDPKHPYVVRLMSVWSQVTGETGEPYVMGGGTYARKIPHAVGFGPGQERDFSIPGLPDGHGNCHCADEAESIENLLRAAEIYAEALAELDEAAAGDN